MPLSVPHPSTYYTSLPSADAISEGDYFYVLSGGIMNLYRKLSGVLYPVTSGAGLLDWDTAWADAVHDHSSNAEGGTLTQYQLTSAKDNASGYAGLNASTRTIKGVDTSDDLIIDLATKGLVLKDTQGTPHYWRITVSILGALITSDLGTTKP